MSDKEVLGAKDVPDTRFLSAKEKFNLLLPTRRIELLSKMSDEDAAKLHYDWDFNGRPKQLAPHHANSRATSFCMCKYLVAQSQTDKKLKLENFPSCTGEVQVEVQVDEEGEQTIVEHEAPRVCQFRRQWSVWVLLAGRGFGKTRVGAELVRDVVESGQAKRIHIIAPTAADARDVAVEGESGLLNISPPWNRPLYESTKRRLTWPNGAVASLFSAEEPERLRGPQCDFSWCLIEGTKIATESGQKNVEDIQVGELVHTRKGLKKVYNVQMTGTKPILVAHLSNGLTLVGTSGHKVWVDGSGWLELQFIKPFAKLYSLQENGLCDSRTKELVTHLNSAVISPIVTALRYIGSFMKRTLDLFLKGSMFIIKMETYLITNQTIWKPYQVQTISEFTTSKDVLQTHQKRNGNTQTNSGKKTQGEIFRAKTAVQSFARGINVPVGVAISALKKVEQKVLYINQKLVQRLVSVRSVKSLLKHLYVVRSALQNVIMPGTSIPIRVLFVEKNLSQQTLNVLAHHYADTNFVCSQNPQMPNYGKNGKKNIEKDGSQLVSNTWNLSVEDAHEYFANGVLAKNCDEIAAWDPNVQKMVWDMMNFGLRLGKNPRAVVTTTPKPTVLIQDLVKQAKDPMNRTIITTGSTYENRTNLAAPFMRSITQYEGTNLGRQEIYAELIDIEESGILKRSWFKHWKADRAMPQFDFVLQSYDTAFTQQTENDPTGCLVFGIFRATPDSPYSAMLLDAWTDHMKYPDLRTRVTDDYKNTYGDQDAKVDIMLIEDKGSGISLIQDLQRAGLPIRKYNPGRPDKIMRLHSVSHLVYNGLVYIPESKKVPGEFVTWAEDFIREVCSFPNSPHDEYVDCLSQALAFFRDQEWMNIDPEPDENPFEDDDDWDNTAYQNPYSA